MCSEDAEWRPAPGQQGARLGPCFASPPGVAFLGEFSQLPEGSMLSLLFR